MYRKYGRHFVSEFENVTHVRMHTITEISKFIYIIIIITDLLWRRSTGAQQRLM